MKNIKYLFLLVGILNLWACKDFLEETPPYKLTKVTDYASAKNIVNGIYSKLTERQLGGELAGRLSTQAGVWNYSTNLENYAMTYREGSVGEAVDMWRQLYDVINAANAAVESISALDDGKFPTAAEKQRLIAEAKCIRAFIYAQIHWLWSHWWDKADNPYGLIYRSEVADLSNLQKTRLSVGDSYARIIEDLEYAESYLNNFQTSRYVSKQFAQIIHAKLLLNRAWEGDYAKALSLVQDVKAHSPASFSLETDMTKMYLDSWDSKEVLFARYIGDLARPYNNEWVYSNSLWYNDLYTLPQSWVEADPRYPAITGIARAPEAWNAETKTVYTKLYRTGQTVGPNEKYATYYFRYSELYLLESELKFRLNPSDINGALAPINELRSRYTNPVMPALTASNQEELSDLIFKEIVVSLFLENGSEWFAALRFQKNGKPWLYTLKSDVSISPDKYCWPIPLVEIINQDNGVEQNPTLK